MSKLCPQCQQPLNPIERWGVHLEVCQQCQGVWLQSGELEQIIGFVRASAANAEPEGVAPNSMRPQRDHDNDDDRRIEYDKNGNPHRKRRFEIGEIFDIFG
jgi:Zn-finger nucleic acid-binding protein